MVPKIGDRVLEFDLPGVDGKRYSADVFKDKKILVVMFTCNHCPYVKAYEDRLVAIQSDYAEKGVQLVAINANDDRLYPEDSFDNMVIRAKEKGFNFPYLRDADQSVVRAYGAQVTPEIFLFDSERRLRYHGRIDDSRDPATVRSHDLRSALNALLGGRQVPIAETWAFGCSVKWSP